MQDLINRQIVLAAHPSGMLAESDFTFVEKPVRQPAYGQLLVRVLYVAVDPGLRARLDGVMTTAPPLAIGNGIEGAGVGEVIASRHPKIAPGEMVAGALGWQTYALMDGRSLRVVPRERGPLTASLGVLGEPGLAAYFGLLDLGAPKSGETVLISSAAGPVGSAAGQIARMRGCRVIGIAGSSAKCLYIKELGFEIAIDYRATPDLGVALKLACPEGIDIFFDNVGGSTLNAGLRRMKPHGRIVLSGLLSEYNLPLEQRSPVRPASLFHAHRLRMMGLLVSDYTKRFPEALAELTGWVESGRLRYREEITVGLENLPRALLGVLQGENLGRRLVRVGPEPLSG